MATSYSQKLRDPRWQKKRLEVLESANWQCEICSDDESTLHVHHKEYFKGKDVWDYDRNQLSCLCSSCHEMQHSADLLRDVCSRLSLDGPSSRNDAAYLLAGFAGLDVKPLCVGHERLYEAGRTVANRYWGQP
jgi:hypothetical protein